jgi:hypothetical protein
MKSTLAGRVRNTPLATKNALLPLFEAVVNSVDSIHEFNDGPGRIEVGVERQPTFTGAADDVFGVADISGFSITDDGVGFIVSNGPWFVNADAPVQAFPGPDFVTGWGMVNAEEAVKVVRERAIVEGALTITCDSVAFSLEVAADGPLRVTLAWDDAGGRLPRASLTAPVLVNDLDLVLVDPAGEVHRPWLLDQVAHSTVGADDLPPEEAAAGLSDSAQTCGTPLRIERRVRPTDAPLFSPWKPDTNRNDPIEDGALRPAGRGRDHLNNVEQVFVASPRSGTWRVWVVGFDIPEGPQRFSLVGIAPPN